MLKPICRFIPVEVPSAKLNQKKGKGKEKKCCWILFINLSVFYSILLCNLLWNFISELNYWFHDNLPAYMIRNNQYNISNTIWILKI